MSNIISYSQENLDRIVDVLERGGIVVFPTETVYALACRADDHSAAEKIYKIKGRTPDKVFAVLAPNVEFVDKYAEIEQKAYKLISKFSPGAVTYILPIKEGFNVSDYAVKGGRTGFRIPNHPVALEILNRCNFAVIATSVNRSGQKSADSVSEIDEVLLPEIDLVLDGEKSSGVSSGVFSFGEEDELKVIREGEVSFEEIQKAWKDL
jgi:L-threonylcarbamoyladenylate synthase